MKHRTRGLLVLLPVAMSIAASGCGGARTSHVALLSEGNLAGKLLPRDPQGPKLRGEDCGLYQHLANAFRGATAGTAYDTLVDVEVTSTTGAFPASNCIQIEGRGVKSAELPSAEGRR